MCLVHAFVEQAVRTILPVPVHLAPERAGRRAVASWATRRSSSSRWLLRNSSVATPAANLSESSGTSSVPAKPDRLCATTADRSFGPNTLKWYRLLNRLTNFIKFWINSCWMNLGRSCQRVVRRPETEQDPHGSLVPLCLRRVSGIVTSTHFRDFPDVAPATATLQFS